MPVWARKTSQKTVHHLCAVVSTDTCFGTGTSDELVKQTLGGVDGYGGFELRAGFFGKGAGGLDVVSFVQVVKEIAVQRRFAVPAGRTAAGRGARHAVG